MDEMQIDSAVYQVDMDNNNCAIQATIDGVEMFVPLDLSNRHYAEILRQMKAGVLTITDASTDTP